MNSETKVISIILIITVLVIMVGLSLTQGHSPKTAIQINSQLLTSSTTPVTGSIDAKVSVVEFADFACPACAMLDPNLKTALDPYISGGQVSYALRLIPIHGNDSIYSAMAAFAAERVAQTPGHKTFFDMGHILLDKQSEWAGKNEAQQKELFIGYAASLKVDTVKFTELLNSADFRKEIVGILNSDNNDAAQMSIASTPTLIINGKKSIVGVQSSEAIKQTIDAELKVANLQ